METKRETAVHLVSEYWPFARTGGLAEAVRGIAKHQAHTGMRTLVVMPFYRRVREQLPDAPYHGDPMLIPMGWGEETVRFVRHVPESDGGVEIFFVDHPGFFDRPGLYGEETDYPDNHRRFALLCRAALALLPWEVEGSLVLHPHDWHAALAPAYLRWVLHGSEFYDRVATVLTVHNAGYQGHYGMDVLGELGLPGSLFHQDALEWYGKVNILKGGLNAADMVTTVSPTHAHELRTRFGGFGLHHTFNLLQNRFVGVLNGIDYQVWNPATDPALPENFSQDDLAGKAACKAWFQRETGLAEDPEVPLFAMSARLVEQKGLDLILDSGIIPELPAQFVFLGEGEERYKEAIAALARALPKKVGHHFVFTEKREHELMAAADFLLMPSLYEPCGLTQMRAQRYGALPVARRVGGLADTIQDRMTGYLFDEYEPWALADVVRWAIDLYGKRYVWEAHVRAAMDQDFSWARSSREYIEIYARARAVREGRLARREGALKG